MKIFGGKDYYDCGLSLGIDPSIILVRGKSKSIPVQDAGGSLLGTKLVLKPEYSTGIGIHCVAVAFCDKVYRGAIGSRELEKPEGIWSADRARAFARIGKNASIEVETHWDYRNKMTLEEYFTPTEASEKLRDYMIRNKVSILVEEVNKWHREDPTFKVNPFTLKQIGFAKALDPYTAFQELSMWIGGVLGGTSPEIVRITDDIVLAENHGFDKHSFRSSARIDL